MPQFVRIESLQRKLTTNRSGGQHDTFIGTGQLPDGRRGVPVYFKKFRAADPRQLCYKELLADRVAAAMDVPRTEPFFAVCLEDYLRTPRLVHAGEQKSERHIYGIATVDANPRCIRQIIDDPQALHGELLNWRHAAAVAVFDELIMNVDRNVDNLVRSGANSFVPIDHEQSFYGLPPNPESVERVVYEPTRCNLIAGALADVQDKAITDHMLSIAVWFAQNMDFSEIILSEVIHKWCNVEMETTKGLVRLLSDRASKLGELIYANVKMSELRNGS